MVQTIESFVEKLKSEGVAAGKSAAEKLQAEAKAKADQIIAQATEQAQRIIADAQTKAAKLSEQQKSELELSARDALLRFRQGFGCAIESLLQYKLSQALGDRQFLVQLIRDVVVQYAHDDAHESVVQVRVGKEIADAVADWAITEITHPKDGARRVHLDLKSGLKATGFEYSVSQSTVEVTVDSLAEVMREHMSPRLREVLDKALSGLGAAASQAK